MSGKLYVVATPIGNMSDITKRACEILEAADIIAAEDTRTSQNMLNMLGIKSRLVSNHKFNERSQVDFLVDEMLGGKDVAVVSDAGMPCISDPGSILVAAAVKQGIEVVGLPGACAAVTAVAVSGFDSTGFTFWGFLPRSANEIRRAFEQAKSGGVPIGVWYESPKRIVKTLSYLAEVLPDCGVCLCNDLTKLHERIYRGSPGEVLQVLRDNPNAEKGEYTLAVSVNQPESGDVSQESAAATPEGMLVDKMLTAGVTLKEAVTLIAVEKKGKVGKNELYTASLRLKQLLDEIK